MKFIFLSRNVKLGACGFSKIPNFFAALLYPSRDEFVKVKRI
jgi:hypothetical protein